MSAFRTFAILAVLACVANRAWSLPVGEISAEPEAIVAEASNLDYAEAIPISLLDVDGDASYAAVEGEPSDSSAVELQRSTRGLGLGLLGAKFGGLGFGLPFKGLHGLGGLGFGHGLGFGGLKPLFFKFG